LLLVYHDWLQNKTLDRPIFSLTRRVYHTPVRLFLLRGGPRVGISPAAAWFLFFCASLLALRAKSKHYNRNVSLCRRLGTPIAQMNFFHMLSAAQSAVE
jgi:hypothetical protein